MKKLCIVNEVQIFLLESLVNQIKIPLFVALNPVVPAERQTSGFLFNRICNPIALSIRIFNPIIADKKLNGLKLLMLMTGG